MNNNSIKIQAGGGTASLQKKRDSNIELFRIVTMLLIVAHHFVVNSGLTAQTGPVYSDPMSWRSLFLLLIGAWGKTGINCFVLITGYFMCDSHITAKKFAKLFFEVLFYRVVVNAAFWISGYERFTVSMFLERLIPIRTIGTGFTPAFLIFYLCIPFISALVHHINEKQHVYLLLLCFFLYMFLGTFRPFFSVTMNYVSWFIVLFFIASYIRLYPKDVFEKTALWGWLTLIFVGVASVSVIACAWLGAKLHDTMAYAFVADSNTLLAVLIAVCAFLFFRNIRISYSKVINTIAASTFGVLLIHANSDTMRNWLWRNVLNNVGHYNDPLMPLYVIGCVLAVFIVGSGIDMLRMNLIEKPFFQYVWDAKWDSVSAWYKKLEQKVFLKLNIQS